MKLCASLVVTLHSQLRDELCMQGELSGRLLAYHPSNQKTTVVADGFLYSNGVAVSAAGDFVLVVETAATRIWKIWLDGDKVGALVSGCSAADPLLCAVLGGVVEETAATHVWNLWLNGD